jgi:long-chain acyl-CoA synthetase
MTEEEINTSDYWRKLLRLDEEEKEDVLSKFKYPHRILRPIYYGLFTFLSMFYLKVKVIGVENLPATPPYIVASNHSSAMDYPVVAWVMGKKVREDLYVLVTKLFYDNPFTRFVMKVAANVQRIDIDENFLPGLQAAAKILKRGKSIYINPEGTRSETGELLPFRPGVGMLASQLNVPIVPVYVHGARNSLPTGSIFPKPGRIDINFGKPIYMDDYRPKLESENAYYVYKEIAEEARRRIKEMKDSYK